jgi:hypothetical protein
LRLRGIDFGAVASEARPALVCDDVKSLDVDGFRSAGTAGGQPVIKLIQTKSALLRGCSAPAGAAAFLVVEGDRSESIALTGNNLSAAKTAVELAGGAPSGAVSVSGN